MELIGVNWYVCCSSYDGYGFSQRCAGIDKELETDPLEARARKLDNQARTAQSVNNVSS